MTELTSASAPLRQSARQHAYRRIYPLRTIGMALGGLAISSVLYEQHAAPWRWGLMVLTCLLWPQLAYLLARRSADSYATERRSLLIDSAIAGMWVPLLHFNLLPSVVPGPVHPISAPALPPCGDGCKAEARGKADRLAPG